MTDAVYCPKHPKAKMKVLESRVYRMNGWVYISRRKECPVCGHRYTTKELPGEVADDVMGDDE